MIAEEEIMDAPQWPKAVLGEWKVDLYTGGQIAYLFTRAKGCVWRAALCINRTLPVRLADQIYMQLVVAKASLTDKITMYG